MHKPSFICFEWQKIKFYLLGPLIGISLILLNIKLFFWNEHYSLGLQQSYLELQKNLVNLNAKISTKTTNSPVYISGTVSTDDNLKDELLGINVNAINLKRHVEMYQWLETIIETSNNIKKYNYQSIWSNKHIDSKTFKESEKYKNPKSIIISEDDQYAPDVFLGRFRLSEDVIKAISGQEQIFLTEENLLKFKDKFDGDAKLENNQIYLGKDTNKPTIGDIKIYSTAIYPQKISIIGALQQNAIIPFISKNNDKILILASGGKSPKQIIAEQLCKRDVKAWGIRFICLVIFYIGFYLILNPVYSLRGAKITPCPRAKFTALILSLILWGLLTAFSLAFISLAFTILIIGITSTIIIVLLKRIKNKGNG